MNVKDTYIISEVMRNKDEITIQNIENVCFWVLHGMSEVDSRREHEPGVPWLIGGLLG